MSNNTSEESSNPLTSKETKSYSQKKKILNNLNANSPQQENNVNSNLNASFPQQENVHNILNSSSPQQENVHNNLNASSPLKEGEPNNINANSLQQENAQNTLNANSPQQEGCPQDGVVKKGEVTNKVILTTIGKVKIIRNFVHNLPYNPKLKLLAREKRKAGILPEVLFWQQVHKRKFYAIDFDRQRVIGNYIVDFYVKALGLVVEIDGSSHDNKQEYDAKRQLFLENLGLKVFRLTNRVVKSNISMGMQALEDFIVEHYGEK